MKISKAFILCVLLGFQSLLAANVDTVITYSPSMQKKIKAVIVTPDDYSNVKKYPVLYLLHGYSGDYAGWINGMPNSKSLADTYRYIIVCPDGAYSSWYFDSPVDPAWKYETYISKELVEWVDKNYSTVATREGRAIAGLSMGGHGGLYLGFRHQDVFGACGSMSGGVDIRSFPLNWDISKRLGDMKTNPENWEKHTVMNQLYLLSPNSIKIIIDCGTEDFFYAVNVRLHEELMYRNIPHEFISRPGGHNAAYWNNAILYQGLFFANYFSSSKINNF